MSLTRAVLAAWILLNLGLIGVFVEVRGVELRYRLVERRRQIQKAELEHRTLLVAVQGARAPGRLAERARLLGVDAPSSAEAPVAAGKPPRRRP